MKSTVFKCAAIVIMLLAGCVLVRYYRTDDVRHIFAEAATRSAAAASAASVDFNSKKEILSFAVSRSTRQYAGLEMEIRNMEKALNGLKSASEELKVISASADALSEGKDRIASNRPEWKELRVLKSKAKEKTGEFRRTGEKYSKHSDAFSKKAAALNIGRINTADLRKKVGDYAGKLAVSIKNLDRSAAELKSGNTRAVRRSGELRRRREMIAELDFISGAAGEKRKEMGRLLGDFNRQSAGKKEIINCPGAASYGIIERMVKISEEVKRLGDRLDLDVKRYRK